MSNVVDIHITAFKGFFLPYLGKNFLHGYYSCIINYNLGILLVAVYGSRTVGFSAGFVKPSNFYIELRRKKLSLAIATLPAIIKDPRKIARLLVNYKRTKAFSQDQQMQKSIAELSSISVKPGEKKGIGAELINAFIKQAKDLGASVVRLTTDTYGNERVNVFYKKQGFMFTRSFEAQPGRWLNEYEKSI